MPTVSQGSSATITVTDGGMVLLNSDRTSVARLEVATGTQAGRVVTVSHAGRRQYGPFTAGTLTLSAIVGSCEYLQTDQDDADGFNPAAVWSDSSGVSLVRPDGVKSSLLDRIRYGLTRAESGNVWTRAPLNPAPEWAAATAYYQGQIVRGLTTNGWNLYQCAVAGTSAGSGGPTGTGPAQITDNTVTWQYLGPASLVTAAAGAPTVTRATVAGASLGAGALTWSFAGTASSTRIVNPDLFWVEGGTAQTISLWGGESGYAVYSSQSNTSGSTTVNGVTGTFTVSNASFSFYTDAAKFLINGLGNQDQTATYSLMVEIDGVFITEAPSHASVSGSAQGVLVDYSSAGGRKVRHVRVYGANQALFGVHTDYASKVWRYEPAAPYKLAMLGDSLIAGSAGGPFGSHRGAASVFGRLIGCDQVATFAVGGTGFIATSNGVNHTTQLAQINAYAPDVLLVCGNYNDSANSSAAQTAAMVTWLISFCNSNPTSLVLVSGPHAASSGPSATYTAADAAAEAAVLAVASNRVKFFSPQRNTGSGWQTGTGKINSASGTGNADRYVYTDGTHWTAEGMLYQSQRYAHAFRRQMTSW